jgi:hypothetical protein
LTVAKSGLGGGFGNRIFALKWATVATIEGIRNSVCEAYLEEEEICRREWRRRKREKAE